MTNIGTSFDHYVEDFLRYSNEEQREQILSRFRDIMERLCNGGDPALTELTDLRADLRDRVERLCAIDQQWRLMKLILDRVDPRALDHDPEQALLHAKRVGQTAELRDSIDALVRASVEEGERIEAALGPRVEDVFFAMVLGFQKHAALN